MTADKRQELEPEKLPPLRFDPNHPWWRTTEDILRHRLPVGAAGGAAGAFALTRMMSALLFDVRPSDPTVFVAVAAVLGAVAAIASLIPSARAARIPAAVALRYE